MGFLGDVLAGEKKSVVTPTLSPAQNRLVQQQLDLGEFQLNELKRQREQQTQAFAGAEQQAGQFEDLISGFTGEATPEQQRLIDEAINRSLELGRSDISRAQSQATEQLTQELAPTLGLRSSDTPIQDRGARIAAESVRQQGNLANQLEGQRASLGLEFPQAIQQFQSSLRQNAFLNRLQLAGTGSTAGLGLAGVSQPNAGAVLANQGSFGKSRDPAGGLGTVLGGAGGLLRGIGSIFGG